MDKKYVDMHAHIFPEKIAYKAVEAIAGFYNIQMRCDGTIDDLLVKEDMAGIEKILVHSTATKPEQVRDINNYIIKSVSNCDRFIGFGTMHPDFDDIDSEIQRIIDGGLKGIKLHPDFQMFNIDDPKVFGIYETCEGRLPILFHTGDDRYDFSRPKRLADVLEKFPDLVVIAAHFGGYSRWEEALEYLAGRKNVYMDTSSSLGMIDDELARKIIEKHGADNMLFGSDYPMWEPKDEIDKLINLGIGKEDLEKILHKNAEIFLGLAKS